jgi:hypothetical protein
MAYLVLGSSAVAILVGLGSLAYGHRHWFRRLRPRPGPSPASSGARPGSPSAL